MGEARTKSAGRTGRARSTAVSVLAVLLAGGLSLAAAPPPQPPPVITTGMVDKAVDELDGIVQGTMRRTGVPGVAVAAVHDGKVVFAEGFGVRRVGESAAVNEDTVFQMASLSKPMASTVIAATDVDWQEPVTENLPGFALKDPWVSDHVTVTDLLSHRSGLPDHAGDLLEDLGYDQAYILDHLVRQPLSPFRASYAYTNFGFTAAAEAVARAKGVSWDQLAQDLLYAPANMNSTSSRFADYEQAKNRAVGHVKDADGAWRAEFVRDADAQAPAGGVSSSVSDMATWLRLQLGQGKLDGKQLIPAERLTHTWQPETVSQPPPAAAGRTGFYGLGWNVGYDDLGRLRLSHSGAFSLGANTSVIMLPGEQLAIVVLTNGAPVGAADAIALSFMDVAQHGKTTTDWLPLLAGVFEAQEQQRHSETDYTAPPVDAEPALPAAAYTGTYVNDYYGPMTVTAAPDGRLTMRLGPTDNSMQFPLTHYDGQTFSFRTTGENAVGLSGVTFTIGEDGKAQQLTVESLDSEGLGTFTRR
ncbi:serine hydrolase [Streptomyces sp. NPDC006879]|uniref:serine hydrolase n=1 Tax=Streptomyces sp. NPDC006879 TaxID=3364767 RepID=UPI0036AAC2FC